MRFCQLEYFVAVARERHFARAAAECHVSQPALSAAINKLERELNVSLINRGHAFEGLTPEGERLVIWAKRILAEHDAFKAEVQAVQSGVTGVLRLGVVPSASTTVALAVAAFCAAHPLARVQIKSGLSAVEIGRRLRNFELDAGVTYLDDGEDPRLLFVPLYEERYVLIASDELLPDIPATMTWRQASALPPRCLDDGNAQQTSDRRCLQPEPDSDGATGRDGFDRVPPRTHEDGPMGQHRATFVGANHHTVIADPHCATRRSRRHRARRCGNKSGVAWFGDRTGVRGRCSAAFPG